MGDQRFGSPTGRALESWVSVKKRAPKKTGKVLLTERTDGELIRFKGKEAKGGKVNGVNSVTRTADKRRQGL